MKIAISVDNGRLNSHFGRSRQFALVEMDAGRKTVLNSKTLLAPEHQPGLFPRWLRDKSAQVIIAGELGQAPNACAHRHEHDQHGDIGTIP